MEALARFVVARPRVIALGALIGVVAAAVIGGGVTGLLSTGGNVVPGSDSELAARLLDENGQGSPNLVVLIGEEPTLGPAAADTAAWVVDELGAIDGIELGMTAWSIDPEPGGPVLVDGPLVSDDGSAGLVTAHIDGDDATVQRVSELATERLREGHPDGSSPAASASGDGVTVEVGGLGPARLDLIATTDRDLVRAELLALPLSLLILFHFFRTPAAAALPLVVAGVAVTGTLLVLRLLVTVTEVSVFARSVTTVLGLAMAMDMSLFLVARYREQRPFAADATTAVSQALVRSGPSILFSGLTTALSLAALLAFSQPLLRSFAYAGSAVVVLALVGGLVVLPAVMILLGDRLDRWAYRPVVWFPGDRWARLARRVMTRPVLVAAAALALLVLLAAPIRRLEPGLNDDRVLPASVESRRVADAIRSDFSGQEAGLIMVAFRDGPTEVLGSAGEEQRYLDALAGLDGVARVVRTTSAVVVVPSVEPVSSEGRRLVRDVRSVEAPVPVAVGGEAARLTDSVDHLAARIPWALGAMMVATGALLAIAFRSVLIPLKALVLNVLSLTAMLGAIVWVFQDGRFASVLGYTPVGLTDMTVPALMFCIAFGLSMDYEVYLLARIRESYLQDGDTRRSIEIGLQRTGWILTASALLMAVVFVSFTTASVTHLKVLGLGVTLAVLVDAFVVRSVLVPALMVIGGRANWWPGIRSGAVPSPDRRPEPADAVGKDDGSLRPIHGPA